jgi:hypothetical protein
VKNFIYSFKIFVAMRSHTLHTSSKKRDQKFTPSVFIKAKPTLLGRRARRIRVCARSKNYYLTRMSRPSDDNNYMCN